MVAVSGEKTQRLNILISKSLEKRLTSAAIKRGISKSAYVRLALELEFDREQEVKLQRAVRELAPLYEADKELTAFTDLDGEDFS